MDSYFNLNGKLKTMQKKLASAAKYIPKDLMKQMPYGKKKSSSQSGNYQEEELNSNDNYVIVDHNQQKTEQRKDQSLIDDKFFNHTKKSISDYDLTSPSPDEAVNDILKNLFSGKQLETQASIKVRGQAICIMNTINSKMIDLTKLQRLTFSGIPDEIRGLRPIVWRILLNHLPLETAKWDESLEKSLETYDSWKQELIIKPTVKTQEEMNAAKKHIDHPLSVNTNSTWNKFFKDQDLWDEIEKDVKRTRTDLSFFYKAVDPEKNCHLERLLRQAECKKAELNLDDIENFIETHADVLARVLFIYAKLNPGVRYVQGMNEVLAVIYYCFWSFGDESIISLKYLESDLFFCFNNLMIEIRDGFLRELDHEHSGITGKVRSFANILKVIDEPVYRNLEEENVNHQFYALRWLMLLMCQEFDMSNVIRLWDTLLSDPERFNFLNFVCVAAVRNKRKICLQGDFAECLETLQRATDTITDVRTLIDEASLILDKYLKIKKKEYKWNRHEDSFEDSVPESNQKQSE